MDLNYKDLIKEEHAIVTGHRKKKNLSRQHENEVFPFLNFLLKHFEKKDKVNFLEIGLCIGDNFVLIGNILTRCNKSVYGIGIDLPGKKEWGGTDIDPIKSIRNLKPKFKHEIMIGDSHNQKSLQIIKRLLKDSKIDFLYIDGDHSYNGCKKDYEMYKSLVVPGGLIIFHDIKFYKPNAHIRVDKVWNEIKHKYIYHEFSHQKDAGIGALEV